MNKEITLSYVLTTFNKLPYLREVMKHLLENVQPDEEIVITDGASTDGTVEFLTDLFNRGKIHQFISEPDKGESHGFNKGILMARGELIKLLTDDDVFYFSGIQDCKKFMLGSKSIDIVNTHGGWFEPDKSNAITKFTGIYEEKFKLWLKDNLPFAHCCLGIMFRKSSLPLIGLLEVGIVRADAHFSLKFTSLKIKFAWYTGCVYVRILNTSSNSSKYAERIKDETKKLNIYYGFDIDKSYEYFNSSNSTLTKVKRMVYNLRNLNKKMEFKKDVVPSNNINIEEAFIYAGRWLENVNDTKNVIIW